MKSSRMIRILIFACLTILVVSSLASCDGKNTYYLQTGKEVSLDKTAVPSSVTKAGEVITYTYKVKYQPTLVNPVTLSSAGISISDSPLDGPIVCPKTVLASGEEVTCTATYTVTEADIAAGGVTNKAKVTGTFTSIGTKETCSGFSTTNVSTVHNVEATDSVTVSVIAPAQSNVEVPPVVQPAPPANPEPQVPILTGDVPYCDLSSRAINLRLVDGFVPTDFNHKLTISGEPMGCKVSEANSTILSCLYPPTTVFPASIQATLNGNIVNEFEFSGATCTLPDRPKNPGGENEPPVVDACANDPSPDCLPIYCTYHPFEFICTN
jgi:hypothetical protein